MNNLQSAVEEGFEKGFLENLNRSRHSDHSRGHKRSNSEKSRYSNDEKDSTFLE